MKLEVLFQYLIALVVFFHGVVYLNGGLGRLKGIYEGWKGSSVLLRKTITGDKLMRLTRALWAIAGIGTILTGIVIALASTFHGLWQPVAIVASAVAILSFAVSWDGQVRRSPNQGIIGMALSLIILLGAVAFPLAFV